MREVDMYLRVGALLRAVNAVIHLEKDLQRSPPGLLKQIASTKTINI